MELPLFRACPESKTLNPHHLQQRVSEAFLCLPDRYLEEKPCSRAYEV